MHNQVFSLVVALVAIGAFGLLSLSPLSARLRIPLSALVLLAAAAAAVLPQVKAPSSVTVDRVVAVALVCILFQGGMSIGLSRFARAWAPILMLGTVGTVLTAGGAAALLHLGWGLDWWLAALVATAISPTDPAVVFSVLGSRRVKGPGRTILEGESGANDPVGIALMAGLLGAGGLTSSGVGHVASTFGLQMVVGVAVGWVGGQALLWVARRMPLGAQALHPLRVLAGAFALYGLAGLGHGSGFLAVFVAGILLGEQDIPHKAEIDRFSQVTASLGEIVAFVVLGLTVDLHQLIRSDVWVPGVVLAAVLACVIRPVVAGVCLWRSGLAPRERGFVAFAGLKGAVPILLGSELLADHTAGGRRLYGIVVVAVICSVLVQGGLTGSVADRLGLVEPPSPSPPSPSPPGPPSPGPLEGET